MFVVLRKNNIILFICIVMVSFMTFSLWFNREEREVESNEAIATFAVATSGRVIVIDAGHGGVDDGAISDSGVSEKEINLAIAMKLQQFIEQSGGIAILTRAEDRGPYDPNRPAGMTQRRSDLLSRIRDRDETNADMFISIHMNAYSDSRYSGAQVFYCRTVDGSSELAEQIQRGIAAAVGEDKPRENKGVDTQIFVLKNSVVPAVLVECGFLSNLAEAELLQTEEYQRKLAWGIFSGIVRYLD